MGHVVDVLRKVEVEKMGHLVDILWKLGGEFQELRNPVHGYT